MTVQEFRIIADCPAEWTMDVRDEVPYSARQTGMMTVQDVRTIWRLLRSSFCRFHHIICRACGHAKPSEGDRPVYDDQDSGGSRTNAGRPLMQVFQNARAVRKAPSEEGGDIVLCRLRCCGAEATDGVASQPCCGQAADIRCGVERQCLVLGESDVGRSLKHPLWHRETQSSIG